MSRRTKPHPWAKHPDLLTSIRSPWEHFTKVDWNYSRYEAAIFQRPCDSEAVVYTAIDLSVAIVSLRDWTRMWILREKRNESLKLPFDIRRSENFSKWVCERVTWQPAIEAVANTAKHGEYRDRGWEQGVAMPATFVPETLRTEHDACSDGIELFAFMHKHREEAWWDIAFRQHPSDHAEPGYVVFGNVLDGWKAILEELDLSGD